LFTLSGLQVAPGAQLVRFAAVQRFVVSFEQTPLNTVPSQVSPDVSCITPSPQIVHWSVAPGRRHVLLSKDVFPTQVGHSAAESGVWPGGFVSHVSPVASATPLPQNCGNRFAEPTACPDKPVKLQSPATVHEWVGELEQVPEQVPAVPVYVARAFSKNVDGVHVPPGQSASSSHGEPAFEDAASQTGGEAEMSACCT
jgi:hypothetical protein